MLIVVEDSLLLLSSVCVVEIVNVNVVFELVGIDFVDSTVVVFKAPVFVVEQFKVATKLKVFLTINFNFTKQLPHFRFSNRHK